MTISKRGAWFWVFTVSVAINLFFVGAIGAHLYKRSERPPSPPSLGWMLREMDPAVRASLEPQIEAYAESLRPLRGEMFRTQRNVNQLLLQEPMDKDAVLQAFAELRQVNLHYQEVSHEQTLAIISQLEPEQRVRIMRFMSGRRNPMEGGFRDRRDRSIEARRSAEQAPASEQ